ncbi:unnamed protein product [Hermetia illucens]|uniref:Mos1 transposase HTH domain-containing protein n=1 Tax=Hermetia illucens TaxID=343691 RepID=A0A7R8YUB2_HERIL|nr:unnamed protein product [Hermetia illucens]
MNAQSEEGNTLRRASTDRFPRCKRTMECQVDKKEHFHHLLFEFICGIKAAEAARNVFAVYGEGATSKEHLNTLIHDDPFETTSELANIIQPLFDI